MTTPGSTSPSLWRHGPWLAGVVLAPLWYGSVNPGGQALVAALLALSVLLLANQLGPPARPLAGQPLAWLAVAILIFPLLPLPPALVAVLSPERAALAQDFPLEALTWLPMTLSPANTLQRLWELALIVTGFRLAREAALHPQFPRALTLIIATGLGLLAASDVWYRLDGRGPWNHTWSSAAGTFANRSHFANWVYVAALFSIGWLVRTFWPLQSARSGTTPRHSPGPVAIFLLIGLSLGLVLAVACASRGGFLGFLAGLAVWGLLLAQRAQSRRRWTVLILGGTVVFAVMMAAGELLLARLAAESQPLSFRLSIWTESLRIAFRYPLFGTGIGTFVTGFNHYKSFLGEKTFWHAENEYVQLLMETGLIGAVILGLVLWRVVGAVVRFAWRERLAEPEVVFGAIAALTAFAVHASVEFVFQIPSTALLASVLLGFLAGCLDQRHRPVVSAPPSRRRLAGNLAWALALLGAALLQGLALWHWQQAQRAAEPSVSVEQLERSVRRWPGHATREIALTRAQILELTARRPADRAAAIDLIRGQLNRALAWDPYHWELRLEHAWFEVSYSRDPDRAITAAMRAVKLNPLQPQIPFQFARHFGPVDPALAMEFLRAADRSQAENLRQTLTLAWQFERDTAALWSLTPDTETGLLTLGEFAMRQKLEPLAASAYLRLSNRVAALPLAERFLEIKRPDLALATLPQPPGTRAERLLAARAHLQAGEYFEAIRLAEALCLNSAARADLLTPVRAEGSREALRLQWLARPDNLEFGRQLAERIFEQPAAERDPEILRQLAARFPAEPRLAWLVFRTELELHDHAAAARTSVQLAVRLTMEQRQDRGSNR